MPKQNTVDPELEKAVKELVKSATTPKDKMAAIDRWLKLEAIKAKMQDDGFGAGFDDTADD